MASIPIIAALADKVLGIIEKLLDPKQYDIVRMKRQQKALNLAEDIFIFVSEMFDFLYNDIEMSEDNQRKFVKKKTRIIRLMKKFNKYD